MKLYTVGINHYIGYILPIIVTEDLNALEQEEAGEYYKIIYIRSGISHFLINDKELVLTGSYAICLNEHDRIMFYEFPDDEVKLLIFKPEVINRGLSIEAMNHMEGQFSAAEIQDIYYLKQFQHNTELNYKILPLRPVNSTLIDNKLQLLEEVLTKQETNCWTCRSRSYLFEILFSLERQEEVDEPVSSIQIYTNYSRLAVDVIYYLHSSYNKKITIEELTDEFHTNRTTLYTDFKKYTGQSINQYLMQLRLNMASTLLRDTELSIEEIGERTGFNNINYFSRTFKKILNLTPSEYRRVNR